MGSGWGSETPSFWVRSVSCWTAWRPPRRTRCSPSPEAAWELSLCDDFLVKGFKPSPILLEDVEMEDGPLAAALSGP
jgi:hypothetical protein